MEKQCRICLNDDKLINMFSGCTEISQKLMDLAQIQVLENDGFPQHICDNCLQDLNTATAFREKCISSNNNLQQKSVATDWLCPIKEELKDLPNSATINNENNINKCAKKIIITGDTKESSCNKICRAKGLKYACTECPLEFTSHRKYNQHFTECHPDKQQEKRSAGHQCDVCGKVLRFRIDLIQHLRRHTGDRPFKCNICEKTYVTKSALSKHIAKHSGQKPYECNLCPKNFLHQSNLNIHMKVHTGEKKFSCNLCDKKFKYNRTLLLHIKIHTNDRNYPCDQCDKAFVNRFDLGRHLKRHEKKKAIENGTYDPSSEPPKIMNLQQCEKCGRVCSSGGDLRKHMRCHSSERPFKCSICKKGFKGSSAMRAHERTHTKVRPYVCQQCGRSFTQSSNLRIHERLHTGLRPYNCLLCNKAFNRKRDLISHQKRHSIDSIK